MLKIYKPEKDEIYLYKTPQSETLRWREIFSDLKKGEVGWKNTCRAMSGICKGRKNR